jgi:photosystem II stability/assembly factor-like uncharacterized protein
MRRVLQLTLLFSAYSATLVGQRTIGTASLRGVHVAQEGTVWTSGTDGTILHGDGTQMQRCTVPPGADKLDFRAVWGWNSQRAFAMSSGTGDASRLYLTTDGCQTWKLILQNTEPNGFWDGLAFTDRNHGWILGDPVGGKFTVFRTSDGGAHWRPDKSRQLAAITGESIFAASNSSLTATGNTVWFGTGGAVAARVFRLTHNKWTVAATPIRAGTSSSGIFSMAFRDLRHGVAVGGDYKDPEGRRQTAAYTSDGGASWLASVTPPTGYRSAVAWSERANAWIAAGPNGVDRSNDGGKTWTRSSETGGNALSLPWLVGSHGLITRIDEALMIACSR